MTHDTILQLDPRTVVTYNDNQQRQKLISAYIRDRSKVKAGMSDDTIAEHMRLMITLAGYDVGEVSVSRKATNICVSCSITDGDDPHVARIDLRLAEVCD